MDGTWIHSIGDMHCEEVVVVGGGATCEEIWVVHSGGVFFFNPYLG